VTLPEPATVAERARSVAESTTERVGDPTAVNVHPVTTRGGSPDATVDRHEDEYVGRGAGELGRLHAASSAVSEAPNACLHYPEADHTASGPWLVVEPLAGRLSTVHRGSGTVSVTGASIPTGVDAALRTVAELVDRVLEAARPNHERYPVHRDDRGPFTTGLTTFALEEVTVDGNQPSIRFGVSTTPATTKADIEARFEAVDSVTSTHFEPVVPVAHADPGDELRTAVEAAAESVLGDWTYEWGPEPTPFSQIPSGEKVALGTGQPGADRCDPETVTDCRRLLAVVLDSLEGST
jgi:hypothetical protein